MADSKKSWRQRTSGQSASVNDVFTMVTDYAKQETLGPLRGAGRWLAFGTLGALLIGVGSSFILLGLLRLLQTEWTRSATGSLSWLSYLIVLVVGILGILLAVSRIRKSRLYPPEKGTNP
jgi:cytochrome c biogenesis protein CcdA